MKFKETARVTKALLGSLAVLATVGVATSTIAVASPADISDSISNATVATAHPPASKTTPTTRDTAPGGSQLSRKPNPRQADEATQVHMQLTNNTAETLNITSATDSGTGSHWQHRATDLAPGQTETVSNYAAGDAQINLTYTGASSGAVYTLEGETPLVGHNVATGSTNSDSYTINASAGSGYNPTDTYTFDVGHTFNYTGTSELYVVPAGITQLKVTAIGGGSDPSVEGRKPASGAEITGTLSVTPGDVLRIAAGGAGGFAYDNVSGGWGITNGSDNYSGGTGVYSAGTSIGGGGGGATVVFNSSDTQPIVVAGGAGGAGQDGSGGNGGENGSLIGGNGGPELGAGGAAGANTTTQGQNQTTAGADSAGAGGGGVKGGLAGTTGAGGGGGAGSSYEDGLTSPSVSSGPTSWSGSGGSVIIASAN